MGCGGSPWVHIEGGGSHRGYWDFDIIPNRDMVCLIRSWIISPSGPEFFYRSSWIINPSGPEIFYIRSWINNPSGPEIFYRRSG